MGRARKYPDELRERAVRMVAEVPFSRFHAASKRRRAASNASLAAVLLRPALRNACARSEISAGRPFWTLVFTSQGSPPARGDQIGNA